MNYLLITVWDEIPCIFHDIIIHCIVIHIFIYMYLVYVFFIQYLQETMLKFSWSLEKWHCMKAQLYRMEDNFHLMEIFLTIFLFIMPWRTKTLTLNKYILLIVNNAHCAKMEMNEEKPSKFQFHFPVLLAPSLMKKKLSEKSFVFGLPR